MSARSLSVCNEIPRTLVCHFHSLTVCQLLLLIGYGEITNMHACMNFTFVLNSDFTFGFVNVGGSNEDTGRTEGSNQ